MTSPGSQTAGPGETDVLHYIISFFLILFRAITSFVTGAFFESHLQTQCGLCWSPESCSRLPQEYTHTHTESHTHTVTHILTLTHTHTHSHTVTLTHTYTHAHTHTPPTEEWGQPGSQPTLAAREDTGHSQQVTFSSEGCLSVSGSQPTGLRTRAHSFAAREAGKVSVCSPSFSMGRWTLPPLIR